MPMVAGRSQDCAFGLSWAILLRSIRDVFWLVRAFAVSWIPKMLGIGGTLDWMKSQLRPGPPAKDRQSSDLLDDFLGARK